jgi:hypothetical protein
LTLHLPSTPWAAEGHPIHSRRLGYIRFRLQRSERPLVESSSRGAASPASGELPSIACTSRCRFDLAGVQFASGQIGCAFSMQTNTSPLVSTLRPWPICCRHGELEQDMHQRRCKSLYFSGQSKLRKRKQLPNSPLQFVNLRPDKHGMEITPEKLQICSYANNLHLLHHAVVERSQAANPITYFFLHLIQLLKDDDFVGSFLVH